VPIIVKRLLQVKYYLIIITSVLILILLSISFDVQAQQAYNRTTTQHGLASNIVHHVFKDFQGYLWFSTEAGVNRYDGHQFLHYTTSDGLGGNEIFEIVGDSQNRLWFLSFNGRLSYYFEGKFYNPENSEMLRGMDLRSSITSLFEDGLGRIWVSSERGIVYRITGDKAERILHGQDQIIDIRHMWSCSDKDIRMATDVGEYKMDDNGENLEFVNYVRYHLGKRSEAGNGNFLIPFAHGVLEVRCKTEFLIGSMEIDPNFRITKAIYIENSQKVLISTLNTGLLVFAKNDSKFELEETHFSDYSITSMTLDQEGSLWLTTLRNGIIRVDNGYIALRSLSSPNNTDYSSIRTGVVASDGHLWFGNFNGELFRFSNDGELTWKFTLEYPAGAEQIIPIEIMQEQYDGILQVGTIFGLFQLDLKKLESYLNEDDNFPESDLVNITIPYPTFTTIKSLSFLDDTLFVGTRRDLLKFVGPDFNEHKSINNERVTALKMDSRSTLWVGQVNGLYKYTNGHFNTASLEYTSNVQIYDIKEIGNKWIAIATYGNGVILWCTETGYELKVDTHLGLSSNLVRTLSIDDDNTLWVGTSLGLNRIKLDPNVTLSEQKDRISPIIYNKSDGLQSDEIIHVLVHDDYLWISSTSGIVVMNRSFLNYEELLVPMVIESVSFDGVFYPKRPTYKKAHYDNNMLVSYSGIFFRDPNRLYYRYRLKNLDSDWSVTKSNEVIYRSIPPGDYTFEVQAFTADGRVSSDIASFDILITQPFWMTSYFIMTAFVLFIMGLAGFFQYRVQYIRKNVREKQSIRRKINELESQALQAMMSPHFIFNILNNIRFVMISGEVSKASELLVNFAKLIRSQLDSAFKKEVSLHEELSRISLYVSLESQRLKHDIHLKINIADDVDPAAIELPSLLLQPFVENAIIHGLTPKEADGSIEIEIKRVKNRQLLIRIIDDGNGLIIKPYKTSDSNNNPYFIHQKSGNETRLSLGTQLVKERIELIALQTLLPWSIEIKNIVSTNGEIFGVESVLLLPTR
jgi:ligand-binding sensor domain-containing protein